MTNTTQLLQDIVGRLKRQGIHISEIAAAPSVLPHLREAAGGEHINPAWLLNCYLNPKSPKKPPQRVISAIQLAFADQLIDSAIPEPYVKQDYQVLAEQVERLRKENYTLRCILTDFVKLLNEKP